MYGHFTCRHVRTMYKLSLSRETRRGYWIPVNGVMNDCEPPYVCLELNLDLLEEQPLRAALNNWAIHAAPLRGLCRWWDYWPILLCSDGNRAFGVVFKVRRQWDTSSLLSKVVYSVANRVLFYLMVFCFYFPFHVEFPQ